MRKIFSEVVDNIIRQDESAFLLLGDIGVYSFKKTIEDFPLRAINFGIMEQSMVSFASGLALENFIPIVHTIAPFLTERAYEQLKIDFGYQKLPGNFVSVGASYDYASLGCTHHCPSDIGNLLNIPGLEIVVPGTPLEFKKSFLERFDNNKPTYYRLSEKINSNDHYKQFGKGTKIKEGNLATVLAIGPVLDLAILCCQNLDVEIIYLNHVNPIDAEILSSNCKSNKILVLEPFYSGTINFLLHKIFANRFLIINNIGVERDFLNKYGSASEHENEIGLSMNAVSSKLRELINAT